MPETFANHILLNLEILVDKVGPVQAIGHNSTHMSGRQNDIFRLLFIEKALYRYAIQQIQLLMRPAYQIRTATPSSKSNS